MYEIVFCHVAMAILLIFWPIMCVYVGNCVNVYLAFYDKMDSREMCFWIIIFIVLI